MQVVKAKGKWKCNCPDWIFHSKTEPNFECKHIIGTKFWVATNAYLKEEVPKPKVFADDALQCVYCGSIRVIKYGGKKKQIYYCNDCMHRFNEDQVAKGSKYSAELITLTMDLYFSGLSLRKIARNINDHFNLDLNYSTIYKWIKKFVPKISEYVNTLSPELSDVWHADELFVKMRNGVDYRKNQSIAFLWNVMDRRTRFLLASKLSSLRDRKGALAAFAEARKNAHGNYPESGSNRRSRLLQRSKVC